MPRDRQPSQPDRRRGSPRGESPDTTLPSASSLHPGLGPVAIALVLAASLLSLNALAGDPGPPMPAPLSTVARLLTIPAAWISPADVRAFVLPAGLAALLVWTALTGRRPAAAPSRNWFETLGAALVAASLAVAAVRGTLPLSLGWIVRLALGVGWAALLGRRLSIAAVERTLALARVVALLAVALALWHRAALDLRFVRWPIGPVTLCAGLGSAWSASAIGALLDGGVPRTARATRRALLVALCGAAALTLTLVAGRRGALLGLAAGAGGAAGAWGVERVRAEWRRRAAVALALLAITCGGGWAAHRVRSAAPAADGSLALRLAYWRFVAQHAGRAWLVGIGPDQFVCDVTTGLARQRAERPHELHGALEPAAHCEWLQAAYELGLPAGAIYLLLPAGVVVGLLRRRTGGPRLTLAGALLAIVVNEASSVNLRGAVLPVWYWTWLGLGLAMLRADATASPAGSTPRGLRLRRAAAAALALALGAWMWRDAAALGAHARGRVLLARGDGRSAAVLRAAASRSGAADWLTAHVHLAQAETIAALYGESGGAAAGDSTSFAANWPRAVAAWRSVAERCRGYPGLGGQWAAVEFAAGHRDAARQIARETIESIDPYDGPTNELWAGEFAPAPTARLDACVRALRAAATTDAAVRIASAALADAPARAAWQARVRQAAADLATTPRREWADPLSPEVLRLDAACAAARGDWAAAARTQSLAADAIVQLFADHAPVRRAHAAECDTLFRAADYQFRASPAFWPAALDRAIDAERFAVLGIEFDELSHPSADSEFVLGRGRADRAARRTAPRVATLGQAAAGGRASRGMEWRLAAALPGDARDAEQRAALRACWHAS
ncbi:MAG: hypothetical protein U1A27_07250 [Phycisphaerae bacterium]